MFQNTPVDSYINNELQPYMMPEKAIRQAINLAPSTTFAKGTVLGQITSAANEVQTVTISGTPTGGDFTLTVEFPVGNRQTTAAIAYNAAASAVQSALRALSNVGPTGVTVTGGALPGSAVTLTFGGTLAGQPIPILTSTSALTGGSSPAIAHASTTKGRTAGTYKAYANGNSDGSQDARCILPYAVITDAAGYISFSDAATGGDFGEKTFNIPAYFGGCFKQSDLVGLDANGLADLNGSVLSGAIANSDAVIVFNLG